MWTDKERVMAKQLDNEEMWTFLDKIFTLATSRQIELKKKYAEMDNATYGELMKVIQLSLEENRYRLALLKSIARGKKEKKEVAIAPK